MTILVPYVPTPIPVVYKMLELAGASSDDVLYDLGCGDGRIPIIAARDFGVKRAYCVEIRSDLARQAAENARKQGVSDKVIVVNEDMFRVKLTDATIVTLFLLTSVNDALATKLTSELKYGTRIVSHEFRITKWRPLVYATINDGRVSHNIYLYIIGWSETSNTILRARNHGSM
ncbi:class I SAM-dependent methyltransferase [Hyperthermus butylicus]|uniref:Conserved crenarchaeal protein n=1 Tax=Hyperthermus butylicus (strain DSM 5456 / JCM 9403 / PLM1-5) TaxID=415426 RepID=A2BM95_HYPBU|nr:class I SAM-dependent methyltransferase [Hyperthermus butylicus]ABM81106.1 conserved crenarchaeal protein [Hyperthermus butylicus DSM 5456]